MAKRPTIAEMMKDDDTALQVGNKQPEANDLAVAANAVSPTDDHSVQADEKPQGPIPGVNPDDVVPPQTVVLTGVEPERVDPNITVTEFTPTDEDLERLLRNKEADATQRTFADTALEAEQATPPALDTIPDMGAQAAPAPGRRVETPNRAPGVRTSERTMQELERGRRLVRAKR